MRTLVTRWTRTLIVLAALATFVALALMEAFPSSRWTEGQSTLSTRHEKRVARLADDMP